MTKQVLALTRICVNQREFPMTELELRQKIRELEADAKKHSEVARRYEVDKRQILETANLQDERMAEAVDIINQHNLYYNWAKGTIASLEAQISKNQSELAAGYQRLQDLSDLLSCEVTMQSSSRDGSDDGESAKKNRQTDQARALKRQFRDRFFQDHGHRAEIQESTGSNLMRQEFAPPISQQAVQLHHRHVELVPVTEDISTKNESSIKNGTDIHTEGTRTNCHIGRPAPSEPQHSIRQVTDAVADVTV